MKRNRTDRPALPVLLLALALLCFPGTARAAEMEDYPIVKLQSLDKVAARTMTFEARVGSTVKFGPIYIKTQACRKAPPVEKPEAAAFLQIWEATAKKEPQWIFSGWMFSSSPALSPMDHPVYDVWVLDCLEKKGGGEAAKAGPPADPATRPDEKIEEEDVIDSEADTEAGEETEE